MSLTVYFFIYFLLHKMSLTVVGLPRLIEVRSQCDNTLLRYVKEEGEVKGFVQFRGEQVGSADAKFEVHSSESGNGLVHIRSCYNNKYLVLDKNNWIAAKAEKPEEDQSKRSCTLFRPTSVDGDPKKMRITHVHLGNYLCLWRTAAPYNGCVMARYSNPDASSCDVFNVIDWQSLVFLPKYVTFKGDNNKFLQAYWYENHEYLQFSEAKVEDNPMRVGNEIVQTSNGNICIRNLYWNKYWRLSPNWIWSDSTTSTSYGTVFQPVKISNDSIALRNVANNLFCTRHTTEGKESCLNADSGTINSWAKLKVFELVISKKVENVNFRIMDARIYGESIVLMDSSSNTNQGNAIQEQTFDLSYKVKTSSTWSSTVSLKASIETSFSVGLPSIVEGEVKVGFEVAGEYMWGKTKEVEEDRSFTYKVMIPPKTKVTVRVMATRGTCDVPFSYTQRDVLYTGETVTTQMDDGVYTGVNSYSYYTDVKEESLIKDHNIEAAGFKKVAKVSPSGEIIPL
ncbi:uncharacterized protein LOC141717276 [Apium graveolens]|uniref:uncharacterized protein LOC141717276 n=1 Tax=Apium graveolens TaxID=4045 RepID=UPI003D7B2F9F